MRAACKLVLLAALGLPAAIPCLAQVVLDRTVATVNKQVILESDLNLAIAYEKLSGSNVAGEDPQKFRAQVLDRIIDQAVILGALQGNEPPVNGEVEKQIAELRKQSGLTSDAQWEAKLNSLGLTDQDVHDMTARQVQIIRAIDQRFRPSVRVRPRDIENYYNSEYVPAMRKAHEEPQPIAQVRDAIEKILAERQMDELTQSWISTLRGAASIQRTIEAPPSGGKPSKQKEWVTNQ